MLTEVGQVVYRYADEIFALGSELTDVLKGRSRGTSRCGWSWEYRISSRN